MKIKINFKATFFAAIAIASGLVVLLGYFINAFEGVRLSLLEGAVTLSAVVLLVGVINLGRVHWLKFREGQKGGIYSLVLLISLGVSIVVAGVSIGIFGPGNAASLWLYNYVQVPIETSLMALLAVILIYAVTRMLNRRMNVYSLLFIGALVLALVSSVPIPFFDLPDLRDLLSKLLNLFATAGARGILLGVALGTIATGLRILMGMDRPYGE